MHSSFDWIGLVGLIVSIGGFGTAIYQIRELGKRAEAYFGVSIG